MKKATLMTGAAALALCLASGPAWSITFGPDYFGYTGIDSGEATLDYSWVDMSGLTEWTGFADDSQSAAIALPFDFPFYGAEYSAVYVYTNGMIRFSPMTYEFFYGNQCPLPSPGDTDGMVGFYHRDWNPADAAWCSGHDCQIFYGTGGTAPDRWFGMVIVDAPQCCSAEAGAVADYVTAQVQLFENGEILVQVQEAGTSAGGDATIGIEAPGAVSGLNYPGCVTEDSVTDELAVLFTPPTGGTPVLPPSGLGWDMPGNTVTHDFTIFNLESTAIDFTLATGGTESWTSTPSDSTLNVPAGTSATFSVDVEIPGTAVGGDIDEATLTLTSSGDPVTVDLLTLAQPAGDAWQDLSDMPQVVEMPAVTALDTDLFVLGGLWYDDLSASNYVMNDVQILMTDLMVWDHYTYEEPDQSMPSALTDHAACAMNGMVYVSGGQTGDAATPQNVHVYGLDPSTMTWTTVTDLPEARMAHAMVCDETSNTFYIIGGFGAFDGEGTAYPEEEIWAYDVDGSAWDETLTSMPGTRVRHRAEMIDANTILVASGAFDSFMSKRSDLYDISTDTWTQTGDTIFMRWNTASGVLPDGHMCLSGGNSDVADAGEDTFECYYDGYWIPMPPTLTEPKLNVAGTTLDDHLYVVGGLEVDTVGGTTTQLSTIERYPTAPIPDVTIDVVEDTVEDVEDDVVADVPEDTDPGDVVVDMPVDSSTDAPEDTTLDTGDDDGGGDSGCGCAIVY